MKNILKSVLVLLSIFGLFYLLGAFVQVSFDISQWTFSGRYATVLLGGMLGIMGGIVTFIFLQTKNN